MDAREVFGQHRDLPHPGHPAVEEVEPDPREFFEQRLQQQRVGMRDAVAVAGLQPGVKHHRQAHALRPAPPART